MKAYIFCDVCGHARKSRQVQEEGALYVYVGACEECARVNVWYRPQIEIERDSAIGGWRISVGFSSWGEGMTSEDKHTMFMKDNDFIGLFSQCLSYSKERIEYKLRHKLSR